MLWCRPDLTVDEGRRWVEAQVSAFAARTAFEFVILALDGGFLGGCGLNQIDEENHRANLGYWVRSSATGRGVATAAIQQLVQWAFNHTALVRLEVVVSTQNAASLRVAEKAGALSEGVLKKRLLLHGIWHDAAMLSFVRPGKLSPSHMLRP
jgi:ribosomal-protein-serine acetyltransferase